MFAELQPRSSRSWPASILRRERASRPIYRIWPDFEVGRPADQFGHHGQGRRGPDLVLRLGRRDRLGGAGLRHRRQPPALREAQNLDLGAAGAPRLHCGRERAASDRRVRARHPRGRHPRRHRERARSRHPRGPPGMRDELGKSTLQGRSARPRSPAWRPRARSSASRCSTTTGDGETSTIIAAFAEIQEINDNGRRCSRSTGSTSASATSSTRSGSPAARARCASRSTARPLRRRRGGRRRQHRLRLEPELVRAPRRPRRARPDDQRPGQRRAGHHRRLDPPRHAAHLRRLVLLLQGPDRRRPAQAGPRRAGREILSCAAGKQARAIGKARNGDGRLPGGQRHQHGRAARLGRDRRVPSVRQRVHRPARARSSRSSSSTATDLNRDRYFQGHGLVDLMRAIQSV